MSISGISSSYSSSPLEQPSSKFQQRRQDFQQLSQALQSGDLNGAQQAFTDLSKLLQSGPSILQINSGSAAGGGNPVADDFQALGQALSSGDLSQARNDFSKLQSDIQSIREQAASQLQGAHGHHHHHHAQPDPAASSGGTDVNSADGTSATSGSVNLLA